MDHHRIYLSGPICGLTFSESTEWRNDVREQLEDYAEIMDPMRDVMTATPEEVIFDGGESRSTADSVMSTDRGIVRRDYTDTVTSTILFVNLLGAEKASIGTVVEIAWAYEKRIPIVAVMEEKGNPHDHPFIRDMVDYRVDSIERAVNVALSIMGVPQGW